MFAISIQLKYKFIVFYFILFFYSNSYCQIAINELQIAPIGDEPEWIELFNFSDKPFILDSCLLSDASSTKTIPYFTILQGEYAVLTKDTLALKNARSIPKSAVLIEFPLPPLNNTFDCLAIRSKDNSLIDSIYYNMNWGIKGISLERLDCQYSAYDSNNWSTSKSNDSATCGYVNSNAKKNYDLKIEEIIYSTNKSIQINITNIGKNQNLEAVCYCRFFNNKNNFETTFDIPILLPQNKFSYNIALDSINYSKRFFGLLNVKVIVQMYEDEDNLNDTLSTQIYLSYPLGTLLINEFLFESSDNNSDYVEFYNTSNDTINLINWLLHDRTVTNKADTFLISGKDFLILPYSYSVVAFDSTFFIKFPEQLGIPSVYIKKSSFNLNADEDDIVIMDPNKVTIDSLRYYKEWHLEYLEVTKDISLEKINPLLLSNIKSSWTSCSNPIGGTPTKPNSIMQPIEPKGNISASPNPFSPLSSTNDQFCIISYKLPFNQAKISAYIFDLSGAKLRQLANLQISSSQGNIVWDGKNDNGYNLSIGPYICIIEAIDLLTDKMYSDKIVLVIGK